MTTVQDRERLVRPEPQAPFVMADNPKAVVMEHLERDAKVLFQRLPGTRKTDFNAVAHVYASAQWTLTLGSHAARNLGNKKEESAGPSQRWDSMKDQFNNALGRRIGEHVISLVQHYPHLKGRQREMMEALVSEAWQRGLPALTESDVRVADLFRQNVDPKLWRAEDERRVTWPGPTVAFNNRFGWIPTSATRQKPITGY